MKPSIIAQVRGVPIIWDGSRLSFTDGMTVDGDGCPTCYGPNDSGLDYTANGGVAPNWWGIVSELGNPVIQDGLGPEQPVEGFYISTTSYLWTEYKADDVRRYLDAASVPFIVLPGFLRSAVAPIVLGCRAQVTYQGKTCACLVGDFGPATHAGEASMAVLKFFGLDSNPRTGGTNNPAFLYEVWPGQVAVVGGVTYELQRSP